jgi:curved DNA-binding protein CbpA
VLGAMPGAETRKIRRKYEDKASLLRPELISGAPPDVVTAVRLAQELLDTAWDVLGDPDSRKRYDEAAGLRRSGGSLAQPGTGIESAGLAPAGPGIIGGRTGWLGPRRRRNRPSAVPDVRGLFYQVCLEVASRRGLASGPSGSPSARWLSTGWWSIKIPGRRRRRIGAARSRYRSGTRPPGRSR